MCKINNLLCLIAVLFLVSGCSSTSFRVRTYSFDSGVEGAKSYQNAGKPWSINHEETVTRHGGGAVRFELRADDTWRGSHRTEIRFPESGSGWYGFSMFIPDDGSYLGSKTYIGQWHAGGKGSLRRGLPDPPAISQTIAGKDELSHLAIKVYGDKGLQYLKIIPYFPRGEWVDMIYEIKFSSRDNGRLNVWMNGKQVVKYKGPTTYSGATHMFKFGIYTLRAYEFNKPVVVYFDEYRRSESYDESDPSKGETPRIDI